MSSLDVSQIQVHEHGDHVRDEGGLRKLSQVKAQALQPGRIHREQRGVLGGGEACGQADEGDGGRAGGWVTGSGGICRAGPGGVEAWGIVATGTIACAAPMFQATRGSPATNVLPPT